MKEERDIWKEWFKSMDVDAPKNANIWGWKWSFISLGIILTALVFMVVVGPKREEPLPIDEVTKVDSVIVNIE